jgi:hypothetical protein
METQGSLGAVAVIYVLPFITLVCFAIYFIIKHTNFFGRKLFINIFFIVFFVVFFVPYSGTLYSFDAFEGTMTILDAILVIFSHVPSLIITLLVMINIFQKKDGLVATVEKKKQDIKSLAINLGISGIVYAGAYFLFAIFFQWRFNEFRTFYSDTLWGQAYWGGNNFLLFIFVSFTIIRGMFYGFIANLMFTMVTKSNIVYITSICLLFISPAFNHLVPNIFVPTTVRILHLISVTGSMLLFGIIVGNILWGRRDKHFENSNVG